MGSSYVHHQQAMLRQKTSADRHRSEALVFAPESGSQPTTSPSACPAGSWVHSLWGHSIS
jgi:hypothetical protein